MKTQKGRYYLSRVIKIGGLTQDKLVAAALNAPVLRIGKFDWAITDAVDGQQSAPKFVFGKLAKYSSEGHVTVVDPANKAQREALAPNLLVASSPFVYLPDVSGIAFMHVWNGIQEDLFPKRFCSLNWELYFDFKLGCIIGLAYAAVFSVVGVSCLFFDWKVPEAFQSAFLITSVVGAITVSAMLYFAHIKIEELFRKHSTPAS